MIDWNAIVPQEAAVCCECGGRMSRPGVAPGYPAKAHDRQDQAMIVGVGNPCPGANRPTVWASKFDPAQERFERAQRLKAGGYKARCRTTGGPTWAFITDEWVDGGLWQHCSECDETWPASEATIAWLKKEVSA